MQPERLTVKSQEALEGAQRLARPESACIDIGCRGSAEVEIGRARVDRAGDAVITARLGRCAPTLDAELGPVAEDSVVTLVAAAAGDHGASVAARVDGCVTTRTCRVHERDLVEGRAPRAQPERERYAHDASQRVRFAQTAILPPHGAILAWPGAVCPWHF